MRKIVLITGVLLIAASTVQTVAAAERHTRRVHRVPVYVPVPVYTAPLYSAPVYGSPWRDAYDYWSPSVQQDLSDYSEGHVISAPAGR
jgi:hypothetical protein